MTTARRDLVRMMVLFLVWCGVWCGWLAWCSVVRFAGDPTSVLLSVPQGYSSAPPSPALLPIPLVLTGLAAGAWRVGRGALRLHYGVGYLACAGALGLVQVLASTLLSIRSTASLTPILSSLTLGVWGLPGLITRTTITPGAVRSLALSPAIVGLALALGVGYWGKTRRRTDASGLDAKPNIGSV